jgi:flagellar hook-associated protein 2
MASAVSGASSANTSTGLGQGIDVNAFVTAALSGDQANINQVQSQKTAVDNQNKALAQITNELQSLQSAIFTLSDPLGTLASQTATSSNANVLTATASASALSAAHSVTVNSLATTSSYYTAPVASSSTPLAAGSFTLQVGTNSPVTVTVNSTNNTLDELAASINNLSAGVRASVVNDASGSRLAIVSNTSGAPGDITVSGNTTGLSFTKAVTGANASLVVDGIPISSTSNTVTSAINGVTLNLVAPSSASGVSVTVAPDTSKASGALNQFVSAYNTAIKDINTQFTVNADGTVGGPLNGDGSVRDAQGSLLAAAAFSVSGNNGIVNLASLGINLNDDGTLSVDQSTLNSALSSNYSSVQNFIQSTASGFASNFNSALDGLVSAGTGSLTLDAQGLTQTSQSLNQNISDLQGAFNTKQQNLILVYSQVNATLQELPLLQAQLSHQLAGV